jgi:EpsI family protein
MSRHYLVGIALLVLTTAGLRISGAQDALPPKAAFEEFPLTIAAWQGQELKIEADVLNVLKADDVMMRVYQQQTPDRASTRRPAMLWLYAGYYKSQRDGATYHSPMNCLPGNGWTVLSREEVSLTIGDRSLRVNRVLIGKGLDRQLILYWYQDRGRIIANEYWAKGYLIWDAMTKHRTDGALVRISMPVGESSDEAFALGRQFLQDAFPLLERHFPAGDGRAA